MASHSSPFPITNLSNLVSVKLDNTNYLLWKDQLESNFISCDLMGHIDGSTSAPPLTITSTTETNSSTTSITPNPTYHVWRKTDHFVRARVNATLTKSLSSHILGLKTAKEVWDALADLFQQ